MKHGATMNTFLVGGAVRDALLGRPILERDWVVVGETPDSMLNRGFRQVGKDFPVFLHPETQEEYALARREYKQAPGHQGFRFDTDPGITLEEDLSRRDLTINAIAKAPDGTLIDPYGGQKDLADRQLRHVSDAFTEDPLRILRLAQFQARLKGHGFMVHDQTTQLCREMVARGDLDTLSRERVFKELEKALSAPHPSEFFAVLASFNALTLIFQGVELAKTKNLDGPATNTPPASRFSQLVLENPALDLQGLNKQLAIPKAWLELATMTRTWAEAFCQVTTLDRGRHSCGPRARRRPPKAHAFCAIGPHQLSVPDHRFRRTGCDSRDLATPRSGNRQGDPTGDCQRPRRPGHQSDDPSRAVTPN